jgi:ABC-type nitrate/sulfonate/bicarbonate transport system permease component
MAATGILTRPPRSVRVSPPVRLRLAILLTLALVWEALSASGLLFRDVVPSLEKIAVALAVVLATPDFWRNAAVSAWEIFSALALGGAAGLVVGLILGTNRFLARAFEPYLSYFGPTPKIILFPILIMAFGVGWNAKIAMGALSSFFPIALTAAAAIRDIPARLLRVGWMQRLTPWQMALHIYLPAIRLPLANGVRLGFGVAIIGVLLAETKLSNQGIGFLVMRSYIRFDMPRTYALLILVFAFAISINAALNRLTNHNQGGR